MKFVPFAVLLLVAVVAVIAYQATNQAADKAAPPPIDAKVPAKIETASFALG
jgi:hypothetical protein